MYDGWLKDPERFLHGLDFTGPFAKFVVVASMVTITIASVAVVICMVS